MPLKKTELDSILAETLGRLFAADGFTYARATKWLVRDMGEVVQIMSWSFTSAAAGVVVTPVVGARSAAILALFKRVTPIAPADEKFRRALSIDVWRLGAGRARGEFRVATEEDAHAAATDIAALLRSDALPFLARCETVADIDRLFNTDPNSPAARLLSLDNWTRSATALIAAWLAHNPHYDGLVDAYRTLLAGFSGGQFVAQYDALVALLAASTPPSSPPIVS